MYLKSRASAALSSLLASFEVVNRRIATLSERKTNPFHDEIMDFAALLEGYNLRLRLD